MAAGCSVANLISVQVLVFKLVLFQPLTFWLLQAAPLYFKLLPPFLFFLLLPYIQSAMGDGWSALGQFRCGGLLSPLGALRLFSSVSFRFSRFSVLSPPLPVPPPPVSSPLFLSFLSSLPLLFLRLPPSCLPVLTSSGHPKPESPLPLWAQHPCLLGKLES